ncbi:ubiquitin-like-specific protease 1D [Brassica napus]|uniref:ubiquitin-like-specific protease 1D n=1 Tax=Brassica napus TaxID=3708 RepID=UPI0006AB659B|nr:ubiquitin-like-specific protease 1D [Brassica napus]
MTKGKHEVEKESDSSDKKAFTIDWNSVLEDDAGGGGKEHQVPELVIVNTQNPLPGDQMDCHRNLTDHALDELLERNKSHLVKLGPGLPDNGEKIRLNIASLEAEKQRRVLHRSNMDADRSSKLMHASTSGSDVFTRGNAASTEASRQTNTDSKEVSRSTFAAVFSKPKPDNTQSTKAFCKELEDLGCASVKPKAEKKIVTRQKNEWRILSKAVEEKQTGNHKSKGSYGRKKYKESCTYSLLDDDDDDSNGHETPKEWSWEEYPSQSSKRRKKADDSVINIDEEEPQPSTVADQTVELPEGLQEDICYPSSDDPHFVQVCLKDLECLAPQEFLNSPVMNFYIRFLQEQQVSNYCHFFNTYFYKKLSDAVTNKGNDKAASFLKLRRWWKGIDLFRKAYIFIPIHEDVHWSLIIVCIPDKEDESGLTILHLDSLGVHPKRSIVENVKRFLKDEWNFLNQDDDYSSNLPISEKLWRNLPRRINEADIKVPQQKNDFDCGPFVLFFIKRFIEEAPQRLKRKDLGMFDKKWFKPDEASALRTEIRNTLINLFCVSDQTDRHNDPSDDNGASKSRDSSPL